MKTFMQIASEYGAYARLPAFTEGVRAYVECGWAPCPYGRGTVEAQAWDRGYEAARRYSREAEIAWRP